MIITLWHGQNIERSYQQYIQAVNQAREQQQRLIKINALHVLKTCMPLLNYNLHNQAFQPFSQFHLLL